MNIEIEKDVPIPADHERGTRKYPFHTMEVGDSFATDTANIYNSVRFFVRKNPDKAFTSRKVGENQWRVWRTK
jgi:hypothetical protein